MATRLPRTLSVLLECELPLHVAVRLAATAVLTALALVLHHPGSTRAASLRLCLGPRREGFLRGQVSRKNPQEEKARVNI